jgi:hypothetical protein
LADLDCLFCWWATNRLREMRASPVKPVIGKLGDVVRQSSEPLNAFR